MAPLEMILELWRTNEQPFQRLVNVDLKEFGWLEHNFRRVKIALPRKQSSLSTTSSLSVFFPLSSMQRMISGHCCKRDDISQGEFRFVSFMTSIEQVIL